MAIDARGVDGARPPRQTKYAGGDITLVGRKADPVDAPVADDGWVGIRLDEEQARRTGLGQRGCLARLLRPAQNPNVVHGRRRPGSASVSVDRSGPVARTQTGASTVRRA